jgi:hypothetical protein
MSPKSGNWFSEKDRAQTKRYVPKLIGRGGPGLENGAVGSGEEGEDVVGFEMAAPTDHGAVGRLRQMGRPL